MTILPLSLPVQMAKRLAQAADMLKMSHEDVGREALRLFLDSIVGTVRGRRPGTTGSRQARRPARRVTGM